MENAPEITVAHILSELNFPVSGWENRAVDIQAKFSALAQPVADSILAGQGDSVSGAAYAVLQNLSRALNDCLAGFHLAQHGFLNQSNNVVRTALEACDLAQLFGDHPDQAKKWFATEKAHVEFKPSDVRRLLGKEPYDPIHGWLSETGSHSRSIGARFMGSGVLVPVDENGVEVEGVPSQAEIVIGPFADRAGIAFSCFWAGYAVAQVATNLSALCAAQLSFSERDWIATMREIEEARLAFLEAVTFELTEAGVKGAEELKQFFEPQTTLLNEYEAQLDSEGAP